MIRVLLVDDNAEFREVFARLLERQQDIEVVAQAGSLAQARANISGVDVAVIDRGLPDGDGLEPISELRQASPRVICNADGPHGIMHRMNAYSEDLRKKIVEALRRGMTKSEAARSFGVSRSSVKRYAKLADEGRTLAPKKRPGSKPKMDESATKLLEADAHKRPAATLSERREFLQKAAGLRVSESTVSRMLRRLGWSRKKGVWVRARETSS
jgi:transposase